MAKKKKSRSGAEVVGMIGLSPPLPPPPPKPEIDPKWVWPPFPETPPGTTIVAYRDFEPKGIVVLLEDDAQELDGDGVPTVRLRVQHSIGGAKEKRKQKNKKSKGPLAEVTQEELAKMTWDKKWELGEEMRMSEHIDSDQPLVERFVESMRLFHNRRPWTPSLQALWDQFRIYAGVIASVQKPSTRLKVPEEEATQEAETGGGDGGGDEDVSDDDLFGPTESRHTVAPSESGGPTTTSNDDEMNKRLGDKNWAKYQELLRQKDERMDFFVEKTEEATRIFFSSFYHDKGLLWNPDNVRSGPLLMRFYLNFIARNGWFAKDRDFTKGCQKAMQVVEKAMIELPQIGIIARAMPDKWSKGCLRVWGVQQSPPVFLFNSVSSNPLPKTPVDVEGETKLVSADFDSGEKRIRETAPPETWRDAEEDAEGDPLPEATIEEVPPDDPTLAEVEVSEERAESFGGWSDDDKVKRIELDPDDPWGINEAPMDDGEAWGTEWDDPEIKAFVERTNLHQTHLPIRAEQSTRMITDVLPPNVDSLIPLLQELAVVVLKPWPDPCADPHSCIQPPQSVPIPNESDGDIKATRMAYRRHDETKDTIKVLVAPETVDILKAGIGMGISGVWVQLAERVKAEETQSEQGGKRKYKGNDWWYAEKVSQVLPSFWTDQDPQTDMTLPQNNPMYGYDSE